MNLVEEIGHQYTSEYNSIWRRPDSWGDTGDVELKTLRGSAKNQYDAYAQLSDPVSDYEDPKWLGPLREVMSMSGASAIDPYLAIAIATRENGGNNFHEPRLKKGTQPAAHRADWTHSFDNSGLDNIYSDRTQLRDQKLVPEDFVDKKTFWKSPTQWEDRDGKIHHIKNSAEFPWEKLLAFTFASVGLAHHNAVKSIAVHYFGDEGATGKAEKALSDIPAVARRVWVAIAFAARHGFVTDLNARVPKEDKHGNVIKKNGKVVTKAKKSPASAGVNTYAYAFGAAGIGLGEILDIGSAVAGKTGQTPEQIEALKFLDERAKTFHRLNIAIKAAIIATALERSAGSA